MGGKKGRSGRKSKAEEMGLAPLLNSAFPPADRKKVIENLRRIATGQDDKAAVSAANLLLAYAYGKPTEKHEHSGEAGGPITLKIVYEQQRVNSPTT